MYVQATLDRYIGIALAVFWSYLHWCLSRVTQRRQQLLKDGAWVNRRWGHSLEAKQVEVGGGFHVLFTWLLPQCLLERYFFRQWAAEYEDADSDKDGAISREEWKKRGGNNQDFNAFDVDGDGKLSREEFMDGKRAIST